MKKQDWLNSEEGRQRLAQRIARRKMALSAIAKTILDQMGGARRLATMLGMGRPPYFFSDIPNGVRFMWPNRRKSRGNLVNITLNSDDTYNMEFVNASMQGHKTVKRYNGIYFDQLIPLFEQQTGWNVRLGSHKTAGGAFTRELSQLLAQIEKLEDAAKRLKAKGYPTLKLLRRKIDQHPFWDKKELGWWMTEELDNFEKAMDKAIQKVQDLSSEYDEMDRLITRNVDL